MPSNVAARGSDVVAKPGLNFLVESDDPEITEIMRDVFSGGVPDQDQGRGNETADDVVKEYRVFTDPDDGTCYARVTVNGLSFIKARTRTELVNRLENAISDSFARSLTDFQLIHSGAVARNGHGVLIPGPSGTGKSTTVAALSFSGFDYLSDDIAVFGSDNRVRPFPKAIALKSRGWRVISEHYGVLPDAVIHNGGDSGVTYLRPPAVSNGDLCGDGVPVELVLLPRRDDPEAPLLEKVKKSTVVERLVEESLDLELRGRRSVDTIVEAVQRAACYALNTWNIKDAVEAVTGLTAGRASKGRTVTPLRAVREATG